MVIVAGLPSIVVSFTVVLTTLVCGASVTVVLPSVVNSILAIGSDVDVFWFCCFSATGSSGRLSKRDYDETIKLNNKCGFPIASILAALAPIVIPAAIKGTKALIHKIRGSGYDELSGYIPTNPNIKTLKNLQLLYDKYE